MSWTRCCSSPMASSLSFQFELLSLLVMSSPISRASLSSTSAFDRLPICTTSVTLSNAPEISSPPFQQSDLHNSILHLYRKPLDEVFNQIHRAWTLGLVHPPEALHHHHLQLLLHSGSAQLLQA